MTIGVKYHETLLFYISGNESYLKSKPLVYKIIRITSPKFCQLSSLNFRHSHLLRFPFLGKNNREVVDSFRVDSHCVASVLTFLNRFIASRTASICTIAPCCKYSRDCKAAL